MKNKYAFTLIEVLVVISIIALLISILLPALGQAKKAGMNVKCQTQMRQNATAYFLYGEDYKGELPRSGTGYNPNDVQRGQSSYLGSHRGGWYHVRTEICPSVPAGSKIYSDGYMSSNGYFRYPIYYHNYHFWVHTKRFDTPLTDHTSPLQIMPSKAGMLCENEPDYYSLDGGNQKTATPQRMAWRHGGKAGSLEGVMNMAFFDGHVVGIKGSYSDNTNLNGTWGHTY